MSKYRYVPNLFPNTRRLAQATLIFLHVALAPGVYIAAQFGRPRLFALSLTLVLSVIILDALLLMRVSFLGNDQTAVLTDSIPFLLDRRVAVILLLMGVTMVLLVGSVAFYVTIALFFTILLARTQYADYEAELIEIDLGLVAVGSVMLLFTQTLGVAYYANTPDTINHTSTIVRLVRTGQLSSIESTRYFMYPVYHVLSTMGISLTKVNARLFVALEIGILFQVVVVAVFLLIRNLTSSKSLSLTSATLVGFNAVFLDVGSKSHYRALSFVFACIFVYLLFRGFWTYREIGIGLIVLTTWNMTHHVSVLMSIALIAPPVGAWFFLFRHRGRWGTMLRVYSLMVIMFISYYAIITMKLGELVYWITSSSAAAHDVPSTVYLVIIYDSLNELLYASWPFFVDNLHYAFGLGITMIGLWALLTTDRIKKRNWAIITVGALPAIVFYYPNPIWVPLEGLIELDRWQSMTMPFLTVFTALGLRHLTIEVDPSLQFRTRPIFIWSIVFLFVFITLSTGMTNPGLTDFTGVEKDQRQYLSNQELDAAEFVMTYAGHQPVYSHSEVRTYIRQYTWAEDRSVRYTENNRVEASIDEDRVLIHSGLTVFSVEAFTTKGVKVRMVDLYANQAYSDAEGTEIEVTGRAHSDRFNWDATEGNTIYDTDETVIKYKPTTDSSSDGIPD